METKITKKGKNEDYGAKKKEFAQKATWLNTKDTDLCSPSCFLLHHQILRNSVTVTRLIPS